MKRKATSAGGEEDSTAESDITTFVISRGVDLPDNCKSLVKLEVERTTFDLPPNGRFPSLKTLDVSIRKPKNEFLNGLLGSCPVLEDFRLDATFETSNTIDECSFVISIPTLKRLGVRLHVDELESASEHTFIIQTPNLEHLTISDLTVASFKIDEIHSLLEAYVSVGVTKNFYNVENNLDLDNYELEDRLMGIFQGIRHARSLQIEAGTCAALSLIYNDDLLPEFPLLRHLTLMIDYLNEWKLLPCFLRNSRVLQYLELNREHDQSPDVVNDSDDENGFGWKPPKFKPYISPDLKEIKMLNLWRSEDEQKVVNYLLTNASGLKKMSMEYEY